MKLSTVTVVLLLLLLSWVNFLDHTEKISDFNHNFSLAFTFLFSFTWRRRRTGWPDKKSFHGRDLGQSSNLHLRTVPDLCHGMDTTKQVSSSFKRDVVCMSYLKSVIHCRWIPIQSTLNMEFLRVDFFSHAINKQFFGYQKYYALF